MYYLSNIYKWWYSRRDSLYAKKAEAIWDRIKTPTESHSWGTLACVYAGLGQDELALQYAHKVLQLPKPNKFIREQAYLALHQVAEHRQDWKNVALYHKKYVAMHDTILNDQRSLELAAIQKRAEFDRLSLHNLQAQQLQNQRLLTVQKQAELDRLRARAQAEAPDLCPRNPARAAYAPVAFRWVVVVTGVYHGPGAGPAVPRS